MEDRIPIAIVSITFQKHFHEILNERHHNEQFSGLIYFLPSIKINQHKENVNLNLIDCSLDYLNSFSPDKEVSFRPDLLNYAEAELRSPQVEILYQFFRQMAETSNASIIRNYLLAPNNKVNSGIVWVGPTKQRFDTSKFKLTY